MFNKTERLSSRDYSVWFTKYDVVMRQPPQSQNNLQGMSLAQSNYCKLITLYMRNLHEYCDAKVIGLYLNKYEFDYQEDSSSLIDHWNLKSRTNNQYIQQFAQLLQIIQQSSQ